MFSRMLETGETCYGREGESTAVHFPWTRFNYVGVHNIDNVVVVYIVPKNAGPSSVQVL